MIRGGAIGDFVLTLPAIKLLRDAWPHARLEILGYKHIVALAENRFYAESTRSIEYGALARFFARGAELPRDLADYFASFDVIVSYLFDPDRVFETNLRRSGAEMILACPPKPDGNEHAALQLAAPLQQLDLTLTSTAAHLYPNEDDRSAAAALVPQTGARLIALHAGSGSSSKNWPIDKWIALGQQLARGAHLVVVGGEADSLQLAQLRRAWRELPVSYIVGEALTTVAAVLARCQMFIGHDSGISHIAAAGGTRCVLLFGRTNPQVWAPTNENVRILQAPGGALADLPLAEVLAAATS